MQKYKTSLIQPNNRVCKFGDLYIGELFTYPAYGPSVHIKATSSSSVALGTIGANRMREDYTVVRLNVGTKVEIEALTE